MVTVLRKSVAEDQCVNTAFLKHEPTPTIHQASPFRPKAMGRHLLQHSRLNGFCLLAISQLPRSRSLAWDVRTKPSTSFIPGDFVGRPASSAVGTSRHFAAMVNLVATGATSTRRGPSHPAYDGHFDLAPPPIPAGSRLRYLVEDRHGHFGGRAWRGER
jgi:hypothetical protein